MVIFGWIVVSLGTIGLCCSLALEVKLKEPYLMVVAKICLGVMAIGGTILGIAALTG